MSFGPLRVVMRLAAPVYATGPIHIDGLLLSAVIHHGRYDRSRHSYDVGWEPSDADVPALPLARMRHGDDWWYRASAAAPVGAAGASFWTKKFSRDMTDRLDLGRATQVATTMGVHREYLVRHPVVDCEALEFFCFGDRHNVHSLLRRVRSVGKKCSQGYGVVASVETTRLATDDGRDWRTPDGAAARILPQAFAAAEGLHGAPGLQPLRPPYWRRAASNVTRVVVPSCSCAD